MRRRGSARDCAWVFLLSMIILMPTVTPWLRKRLEGLDGRFAQRVLSESSSRRAMVPDWSLSLSQTSGTRSTNGPTRVVIGSGGGNTAGAAAGGRCSASLRGMLLNVVTLARQYRRSRSPVEPGRALWFPVQAPTRWRSPR